MPKLAKAFVVLLAMPWPGAPSVGPAWGQMERVPSSPDPVLRAVPLERQRIAPEPTPGLRVPHVPGRQTIVLQDYSGHIARSSASVREPLPPVVLRTPDAFFARHGTRPHEAWGINPSVRYPEMRPHPARERTCWGWCDGHLLLSLRNSSNSRAANRHRELHADMARQAGAVDPVVAYAPRGAPAGYTEAHEVTLVKRRPPETYSVYARVEAAGGVAEFVKCAPGAPSPPCEFVMPLEGVPRVQVEFSLSMEFWDRRDEVRAAVERLVRSFLAP